MSLKYEPASEQVTVTHGALSAASSRLSGTLLASGRAGANSSLFVAAKDRYGNAVYSGLSAADVTIGSNTSASFYYFVASAVASSIPVCPQPLSQSIWDL